MSGWWLEVDSWRDLMVVASWFPEPAAALFAVFFGVLGIVLLVAGAVGIVLWRRADDRMSIAPTSAPTLVEAGAE